ncbi:MAG: hypothetical protein LBJ57_01190 [Prevotellaceae bacterium]|jgi:HAMP domain-containing protein|nr:hypothetical protein [Prevotellaceae bacterium]
MKKLGIKGKITLGFMALMLLLTASGVISIYELVRTRTSVSGMITRDVSNLTASQEQLNMVLHVGYAMQEFIFDSGNASVTMLMSSDSLAAKLLERPDELQPYVPEGAEVAAPIKGLFKALHAEIRSILSMEDEVERRSAYLTSFMPTSHLLIQELNSVAALNRQELHKDVAAIEQHRYRAVMPCIIAVFAGVALIVMFNYFIMRYFANPLIKITRAVENTVEYKSPFRVSVESSDEVGALSEAITALAAQVKKTGKAEGA